MMLQDKLRPSWQSYYMNAHAIVLVIDRSRSMSLTFFLSLSLCLFSRVACACISPISVSGPSRFRLKSVGFRV